MKKTHSIYVIELHKSILKNKAFKNANPNYDESETSNYMKNDNIEIHVDILSGSKKFTAYTMDFTKKYIDINADYRT